MSHIFFGQIEHHLWQVFATHPPLQKRIRRLDKRWDGRYIQRKPKHYPNPTIDPSATAGHERASIVAAAMASMAGMEQLQPGLPVQDADFADDAADKTATDYEAETAKKEDIPLALVRHSHEPLGAHALVSALLMNADDKVYQRQMAVLQEGETRGLAALTHTLYPAVAALGAPRRLPLLELCLPALKSISFKQYRALKNTLLQLIQADARIVLHEWCLYQLVRHYLDPEFIQVKPSRARHRRLQRVASELQVALSVLAHEGGGHTETVYQLGMQELALSAVPLLPREQCSVAAFSKAVHELANCYPLLKPRVLKAMALAAGEDNMLTPEEKEIIAAMAAVMDCPSPELL
jgi:hypothetical protein